MQIAYRLVRATQTPKKEKLKNIPVEKPMPAIISQVYLLKDRVQMLSVTHRNVFQCVSCSIFFSRLFSLGVWINHSIFAALSNSAGEVDEWLKSTVC
jgi:hypothetical protein